MKRFLKYIYFFFFSLSLTPCFGQEILYQEDFNECTVPMDWETNISYGDGIGFYVGQPTNDNSDMSSIDGTCMMVFDDDILGNNTPTFVAEVVTPTFNTKGYNTIRLSTDISFRAYSTSTFSIYVEEADSNRILLAEYTEGQGTGAQFSDFVKLSLDLSFFTTSQELKLVYIYDDKEMYAWYAGLDNVEVIGSGEGEIIVIEQFNDCTLPEGWSTNILEGQQDWTFGFFENDNSSATSMNSSCFAFFEDDKNGREAPFSTADLMTPWFDGTQFATFILDMELIFRRYGDFENISVLVNDGEETKLVKEFFDAVGGPQITNYVPIQLDLTEYRSTNMQVIFRYDDGNEWGWWTGIDNVKILGNGSINDLCENAEVLDIGKACLPSENKNAVFSGPENSCFPNGEGSLWFRLTAPTDGLIQIRNEANYNDVISIFSGECESFTELSCSNKDEHGFRGEDVIFQANANEKYFIRVSGIDAAYGLSRGSNCLSANYINALPQPTAEDAVGMAMPLEINSSYVIDNSHASIDMNVPADNALARSDLWYTFSTSEHQNIQFDITSSFAENTVVYDAEFSVVHAQLEGGPFALYELDKDVDYYIQVSGTFAIIEGDAEIMLSALEPAEAVSDDCFESTPIIINENITYNNSAQTFSGVHSSCDIYSGKDRWFSFTAEGGSFYLNVASEFITNASVYAGKCDELEEVLCYKGILSCSGSTPIAGLVAGEVYYLQISTSQTNNNNPSHEIQFSLTSEPIELPELSLSVSPTCLENGQAELQILVSSEVPYELAGNEHGELLFEGDEYLVVATPESGCEKSLKGVVDCQGTSCNLLVTSFLSYPSCNGEANGSITLDVENGLGPYTYGWAHAEEDTEELISLTSGSYEVTVTDALGCVASTQIWIDEPDALTSIVQTMDQSISGVDNGSANIEINGGTLPYTASWSDGNMGMSNSDLAPGNYSVTITDYNGCEDIHEFIISELDCVFTVEAELGNSTCFDGTDGMISLSSSADIATIEWNNDAVGTEITNLSSGMYTATITLSDGCQKIETYEIDQPEEIEVVATVKHVSCFGESNGVIESSVSGGNGDFTYEWEDGSSSSVRENMAQGIYTITVTDHLGCSAIAEFSVTQPEELAVASSMVSDLSCADSQDGQVCVFVEGGTEPYRFDWEGLEDGMSKMTDLFAGEYNLVVTDLNQCTLVTSETIIAPLPIEVELVTMSISDENNGEITINVTGGVEPYEIVWFMNGEIIGGNEVQIADLMQGNYSAEIKDTNGCEFTTEEYVLILTNVDELEDANLSVFPNPTKELFTINIDDLPHRDLTVKVFSVNGVDVSSLVEFTYKEGRVIGRNKTLQNGIYYLEVFREGEPIGKRLSLVFMEE